MAIHLLATDSDLNIVGDPITDWTSVDCTKRFNEPGSGIVDAPAYPYIMEQLVEGNRLLVIRDGVLWIGGPMEEPEHRWGMGDEGEPGVGIVSVQFADDLARPAGYMTWPDPALTWANQPDGHYSVTTPTNAETLIRQLVNLNCGPGALAARQIPNFVLDDLAGVGTNTVVTTRLEGLLETCRRVAIDGGGLGFHAYQDSGQIKFAVYAPQDLTATARFSTTTGNLRAFSHKRSAPTVTHALVVGSEVDSPATRTYVEVADTTAAAIWWRVEELIDGSAETDANGELTQEGNEALAEGANIVELATVCVDTDGLRAGVDYGLGDRVTVALPTGVEVADLVRSIHLQATPNAGEYVSSLVGSPEATSDPQMIRLIRELNRRLGRQEAK